MLLFDVTDDTLRQQLGPGLPMPSENVSRLIILGSVYDEQGNRHSARLRDITSDAGGSLASGAIFIQCLDAFPILFTPVHTPQFRVCKMPTVTFIHLNHQLDAFSYASTEWRLVIKFANGAKQDKIEFERHLLIEKTTYNKLARLTRWIRVAPQCYGECMWYGGRALVLSDEGPSLTTLGMNFASLGPMERLVLFMKLYLIHRFGISHCNFGPRNVLRKRWRLLTITNFTSSDINHVCQGWRACPELKSAQNSLRLDFRHRSGTLGTINLFAVLLCGFLFLLLD